ncbi:AzlD domain-containing protein [Tsukamurella sp. 1534]|uniref:AzlD domain-containing protein n=1 Tax=Tsukamurella sp. 1534 TaxID=1151061 RepID=UPI0006ACAC2B|nr:AzlD domain-containing protein [Tsukamurella sp. 1534]
MIAVLCAGAALAAVTFAFRAAGPAVAGRLELGPGVRRTVDLCALALLAGVMVTAAVADGQEAAGYARIAGVGVAGVLAWRRCPLPLVILAAGGTAAALRALGVH